jgi:hypothetical protein
MLQRFSNRYRISRSSEIERGSALANVSHDGSGFVNSRHPNRLTVTPGVNARCSCLALRKLVTLEPPYAATIFNLLHNLTRGF